MQLKALTVSSSLSRPTRSCRSSNKIALLVLNHPQWLGTSLENQGTFKTIEDFFVRFVLLLNRFKTNFYGSIRHNTFGEMMVVLRTFQARHNTLMPCSVLHMTVSVKDYILKITGQTSAVQQSVQNIDILKLFLVIINRSLN